MFAKAIRNEIVYEGGKPIGRRFHYVELPEGQRTAIHENCDTVVINDGETETTVFIPVFATYE